MGFYIWNLSRYLVESGHSVQIITRGCLRRAECQMKAGIPVWRVPFLPIYPFHVHLHNLFVNDLLLNLQDDIDLIHLHTPLVNFPKISLPVLVTVHTPMKSDSEAISINTPLALLVKLQTPFSIRLERGIFSQADHIVVVSHSVARELESYGINLAPGSVLGNGVDTRIFNSRNYSRDASQPYILTVCRLGPRKGLEDLLKCASLVVREYPDIRFYIAGEGPYAGKISKTIQSLNLTDNVFLLGHINDRRQLAELYQEATAVVHPAHYEGLPTVLLEAMACARPVVATAISGALDVVEDGVNGLLVPPHAPDQLAQAIFRLLKNPELGQQIGIAARQTIEARYSWQVVAQDYITQYQQLVCKRRH
jgi:glycosyltransferase involved in cell wall biosynthesis